MRIRYIFIIFYLLLSACKHDTHLFKLTNVDFKLIQIDDSSKFTKKFKYQNDINNCIALMKFKVDYLSGNYFLNSAEPGSLGIESDIQKTMIINDSNQAIDIKGFNFEPETLVLRESTSSLAKWCSLLNLNTYKNLNELQNSINAKKSYNSKGIGISEPIILSVPYTFKNSPFYFKMYFDNGDSIVKRFDLRNDTIFSVKIKKISE
jgi:hypothetical protein